MKTLAAILAAFAMVMPVKSQATDFSGSPVRIVAGAPSGGPMDIVARIIANKLGEELKTPVIVENLPGALVQTAAREVMGSEPDGHTLMMITTSVAVAQALHKNLAYDLNKDFTGVSLMASGPLVLVARPGLEVSSVEDLVNKAKENPGGLSFASGGGTGSAFYLAIEMLKAESGLDFTIVPYQGSAPARTDLLGGHVDLLFEAIPGIISHISDGTVVPLAVSTKERSPLLPEVPTMMEAGIENFEISNWFGLGAPAGTPSEQVDQISTAITKIVDQPDVAEAFERQGTAVIGASGQEFSAFLREEIDRLSQLIEEQQIRPE